MGLGDSMTTCASRPIAAVGHRRLIVAATLVFACAISDARAAELTWQGSPITQNQYWSSPGNWDFLRAPNTGDSLVFEDNFSLANSFNDLSNPLFGIRKFSGITFTEGRVESTIGGNDFALYGDSDGVGVYNYSDNEMKFNTNIDLIGYIGWHTVGDVTVNGSLADLRLEANDAGGGLIKSGRGTLTLNGNNTYQQDTIIEGGTLRLGNADTIAGDVRVEGGTLDLGSYNENVGKVVLKFDGVIDGTGNLQGTSYDVQDGTVKANLTGTAALTKSTAGVVTMSGLNTYSGGTTVDNGTLVGNSRSLQGNITNNGTIEFDQSFNGTYAGSISGTGEFNKTGEGTLTLNGNNSFTGDTVVSAGTLRFGDVNAITGDIILSGGDLDLQSFNEAIGKLTLDSTASSVIGSGNLIAGSYDLRRGTVEANLTGTGALTKTGSGLVKLSGTNTFTGGTTIQEGVLSLAASNALSGTVTVSGGTLFVAGVDAVVGDVILNDGSIEGISKLKATEFTVYNGTIDADLADASVAVSARLVKDGDGIVTLNGNNSYSDGTFVNGGTLRLGAGDAIAGTVLIAGGTLDLQGFNEKTGHVTLDGGSITGTGGNLDGDGYTVNDGIISANLVGTGSLSKFTGGTVTLTGTNTYTGGTTVHGGTLIGNSASLQGAILNNADVVFNQTATGSYAGSMSGAGSVLKTGFGTLTLAGNNSYTGTTTVNQGTLRLGYVDALAGDVIVSGGTLDLQAFNENVGAVALYGGAIIGTGNLQGTGYDLYSGTVDANLTGAAALTKSAFSTVTLNGANTYSGGTTINGGTLSVSSDANLGDAAGGLSLNIGALRNTASFSTARAVNLGASGGTFNTAADLIVTGAIGGGVLRKTGTGTLTLAGANTYSGGTVVNQGTLRVSSDANLGSGAGALSLNGGVLQNTATFSTGRTITLSAAGGTFDTDADLTVASDVSGTGRLTKAGDFTLTLTGNNTYTGGTTVNQGVLSVSNDANLGHVAGGLAFNGGVLQNTSAFSTGRAIALGLSGAQFLTDANLTVGGVISGVGTLVKQGGGHADADGRQYV